jgi:hypothetical protein
LAVFKHSRAVINAFCALYDSRRICSLILLSFSLYVGEQIHIIPCGIKKKIKNPQASIGSISGQQTAKIIMPPQYPASPAIS